MFQAINKIKKQLSETLPGSEAQYAMAPVLTGDFSFKLTNQKAGVLFLLYPCKKELFTVFIKRTEYEGVHSGQISLPGGKFEQDDKDLCYTALREAREEIGILHSEVEILGRLTPLAIPVSGFEVSPFVGFVKQRPDFLCDTTEVEYIIESEIRVLIDPLIRKKKIMTIRELSIEVPYFDYKGNHIWGATAMILMEFVEVLNRVGVYSGN